MAGVDEGYFADGGSGIRFPINLMSLFFHVEIFHGEYHPGKCDVGSCPLVLVSPACNHRSVAPCRILEMEYKVDWIQRTNANVLLCGVVDEQETDYVSGFSVFDYEKPLAIKFTFEGFEEKQNGLFVLFLLITLKRDADDRTHQGFVTDFDQYRAGKSLVDLIRVLLTDMDRKYESFDKLAKFKLLIQDLKDLGYGEAYPSCVNESTTVFRAVWLFQQACSVRLAFWEGNHRHAKYISMLFNMAVADLCDGVSKTHRDFFCRKELSEIEDIDLSFGLSQEEVSEVAAEGQVGCNVVVEEKVMLQYLVAVAVGFHNASNVVSAALRMSKISHVQLSASVRGEDVHDIKNKLRVYIDTFQDLLNLEQVRDFRSFCSDVLEASSSAMQYNRVSNDSFCGSDVFTFRAQLQNVLFVSFYGENSKKVATKEVKLHTTLYGSWASGESSFMKDYFTAEAQKLVQVVDDHFFLFLFLEGCPDVASAQHLLDLITMCYRGLHHDASKAHNILHTKVIASDAVFKDACYFIKLAVDLVRHDDAIEYVFNKMCGKVRFPDMKNDGTKNVPAFKKRLDSLSQNFFFWIVVSLIEHVGLFPEIPEREWRYPQSGPNDPPQEVNSLKYLCSCLDGKSGDNSGRKCFLDGLGFCLINYIASKIFTPSYASFQASGGGGIVKAFFFAMCDLRVFADSFFGNITFLWRSEEMLLESSPPPVPTKRTKKRLLQKSCKSNKNQVTTQDSVPVEEVDRNADVAAVGGIGRVSGAEQDAEEEGEENSDEDGEEVVEQQKEVMTPAPKALLCARKKKKADAPTRYAVFFSFNKYLSQGHSELCEDCQKPSNNSGMYAAKQGIINMKIQDNKLQHSYHCREHAVNWREHYHTDRGYFVSYVGDDYGRGVQLVMDGEKQYDYKTGEVCDAGALCAFGNKDFTRLGLNKMSSRQKTNLAKIYGQSCDQCTCANSTSDNHGCCLSVRCPNYSISIECSFSCGDGNCGNRRVSLLRNTRYWELFAVKSCGDLGQGLFCKGSSFQAGQLIIEYVGVVISKFKYGVTLNQKKQSSGGRTPLLYIAQLHDDYYVNAEVEGNEARYINHSCNPNCKMEKWTVDELPVLAIFAIKDIADGDELTMMYNMDVFNEGDQIPCLCSSDNCKQYFTTLRTNPTVEVVDDVLVMNTSREHALLLQSLQFSSDNVPYPTFTVPKNKGENHCPSLLFLLYYVVGLPEGNSTLPARLELEDKQPLWLSLFDDLANHKHIDWEKYCALALPSDTVSDEFLRAVDKDLRFLTTLIRCFWTVLFMTFSFVDEDLSEKQHLSNVNPTALRSSPETTSEVGEQYAFWKLPMSEDGHIIRLLEDALWYTFHTSQQNCSINVKDFFVVVCNRSGQPNDVSAMQRDNVWGTYSTKLPHYINSGNMKHAILFGFIVKPNECGGYLTYVRAPSVNGVVTNKWNLYLDGVVVEDVAEGSYIAAQASYFIYNVCNEGNFEIVQQHTLSMERQVTMELAKPMSLMCAVGRNAPENLYLVFQSLVKSGKLGYNHLTLALGGTVGLGKELLMPLFDAICHYLHPGIPMQRNIGFGSIKPNEYLVLTDGQQATLRKAAHEMIASNIEAVNVEDIHSDPARKQHLGRNKDLVIDTMVRCVFEENHLAMLAVDETEWKKMTIEVLSLLRPKKKSLTNYLNHSMVDDKLGYYCTGCGCQVNQPSKKPCHICSWIEK